MVGSSLPIWNDDGLVMGGGGGVEGKHGRMNYEDTEPQMSAFL
jgi:hypothetical protein